MLTDEAQGLLRTWSLGVGRKIDRSAGVFRGPLREQFWGEISPINLMQEERRGAIWDVVYGGKSNTHFTNQISGRVERVGGHLGWRVPLERAKHQGQVWRKGAAPPLRAAFASKGTNNFFGVGGNVGSAVFFSYLGYKANTAPTETWKPSIVEKGISLGSAIGSAALMLAVPWFLDLGFGLVLGATQFYFSYNKGKIIEAGYNHRNWYRPNLAPIYTEGAIASRREGINSIMQSSEFIGREAQMMASRRY